jgi:hypothetical protein
MSTLPNKRCQIFYRCLIHGSTQITLLLKLRFTEQLQLSVERPVVVGFPVSNFPVSK